MKKLVLLMLVLGMASLANAAVYVHGIPNEFLPGDIITLIIGNDAVATGGTTNLTLNVSWGENGSAEILGTWMLPPTTAATITDDGIGGLDFAFGDGTIGLNVTGDWLSATFTVPMAAAIGSTLDLSWSGWIFNETPPNASIPIVGIPDEDCPCYGDYDGDGYVTSTDMNYLLMKLFEKLGTPGYEHDPTPAGYECVDLDTNNKLNTTDMGVLLFHLFSYGMGNPGWSSPCMPAP